MFIPTFNFAGVENVRSSFFRYESTDGVGKPDEHLRRIYQSTLMAFALKYFAEDFSKAYKLTEDEIYTRKSRSNS